MHVRTFAGAMLAGLAFCSVLAAQPHCSAEMLRGTWAFGELGWTVPLGSGGAATASPVTVIGVLTIDTAGNIAGSGTTVSGTGIAGTPIPAGEVLDFDFTGMLEITPDCTGSLRYTIQLKGAPMPVAGLFIERFVYSPKKDEILSMSLQSPLSKPLWIGQYTRLGHVPVTVGWPAVSR